MTNPTRILPLLASALLASVVLSACNGGDGATMSDEDKIKTMQKAHDTPIGPSNGAATPGAAATPPAGN